MTLDAIQRLVETVRSRVESFQETGDASLGRTGS
jgi:hypothetical protein